MKTSELILGDCFIFSWLSNVKDVMPRKKYLLDKTKNKCQSKCFNKDILHKDIFKMPPC